MRADSPEGLYSAVADAGVLRFLDAGRRTLSQTTLDASGALLVQRVQFSADGRWLAVGGTREGQAVQFLVAVSGGKVLWERAAVGLVFDAKQPVAQLQLASGEVQNVALRAGEQP